MNLLCVGSMVPSAVLEEYTKNGAYFRCELLSDWDTVAGDWDAIYIDEQSFRQLQIHWRWSLYKSPSIIILYGISESGSGSERLWNRIKEEYRTTEQGNIGVVHLFWGKLIKNEVMLSKFPCTHRSEESVREVGCKPCQSLTGLSTVPVFWCSLKDCECSLGSNELTGKGRVNQKTGERLKIIEGCTICTLRSEPEKNSEIAS